jgi:hypothetical protein
VPLLGLLDLTVVALLLFIRVENPMHKGAAAIAWVSGLTAVAIGLI